MSKPPMTNHERLEESTAAVLSEDERRLVEGKPSSAATRVAKQAMREAKSAPARTVPQIQRGDFELVEFKQADWAAIAAFGAQPEDFDLKPEMWSMVSDKINTGDLVRLRARDDSWFAVYVVISGGTSRANAKLLMATELPARETADEGSDLPDGYDVRPGNAAQDPWVVIRLADAMIMNVGQFHRTREEARRWLKDHAIFRRSN